MKKMMAIILICAIFVVALFLIFYFVTTSSMYHWAEINKFIKDPKTFIVSSQRWSIHNLFPYKTPEGKFSYHINKLIERGEIEYKEFDFVKKKSYNDLMDDIKKTFPDLIWMQLHDNKDIFLDKNNGYILKFWAKPQTMDRFNKFYQNYLSADKEQKP
jgi:hypothetical protein